MNPRNDAAWFAANTREADDREYEMPRDEFVELLRKQGLTDHEAEAEADELYRRCE